jgi:hypothetical protein
MGVAEARTHFHKTNLLFLSLSAGAEQKNIFVSLSVDTKNTLTTDTTNIFLNSDSFSSHTYYLFT